MSPYERVINIIEKDVSYTITDLHKICEKAGYFVSRQQIYKAVFRGKLNYAQFGGYHSRIEIEGAFFLEYLQRIIVK